MNPLPAVGVVMLAYGPEPYLRDAVSAVLASTDVQVRLVVVDNGCTTDAVERLPHDPRTTVIRPDSNLGFTGGVDVGARDLDTPVLAFVNSDAIVAPDALAELARALDDPTVGLVSALIRLGDDPELVNSVGNPVHVVGLSWAGHMNEPVRQHRDRTRVASVSGACMAVRADTWRELGGFPVPFFAYLEDLELSWRTWQRGWRVEYVPTASAVHHYEFSRSPLKMYLVERNRLLFISTCYATRTLVLLAPPLLAFELAITLIALMQGWGREKLRGWAWIVRHESWIRSRRREVQSARTVSDRSLADLWVDWFDPAQLPLPAGGDIAQRLLRVYWRVVRRLL